MEGQWRDNGGTSASRRLCKPGSPDCPITGHPMAVFAPAGACHTPSRQNASAPGRAPTWERLRPAAGIRVLNSQPEGLHEAQPAYRLIQSYQAVSVRME